VRQRRRELPFGQFAYCNAPAFFTAAKAAVRAGQLRVPALGTARDGQPCPTTRDFSVVDQDQSDNLDTKYLALADGRTAQSSPANQAQLSGATVLTNASDNGLLDRFIDPALGCQPFTAPDLSGGNTPTPALALNELQAAADQDAPVALVPPNDPMAQINGQNSTAKTNLYRAGVDMAPVTAADTGAAYCTNLGKIASTRLALDQQLLTNATSPDPAAGATLFDFLTQRLTASWTNLNCQGLIGQGPPPSAPPQPRPSPRPRTPHQPTSQRTPRSPTPPRQKPQSPTPQFPTPQFPIPQPRASRHRALIHPRTPLHRALQRAIPQPSFPATPAPATGAGPTTSDPTLGTTPDGETPTVRWPITLTDPNTAMQTRTARDYAPQLQGPAKTDTSRAAPADEAPPTRSGWLDEALTPDRTGDRRPIAGPG